MANIILYNSDNYDPIFNEKWAKELKEEYIRIYNDADDYEIESNIQSDMELCEKEDFNNIVNEISKSTEYLLLHYPHKNNANEMIFNRANYDFGGTIQDLMDSHHPSTINNITIGVDEKGTLFIDIHSGNATYPTRTEIKSLTKKGQNIIDTFDDSSDLSTKNAGWFRNLSKNGFDEEDLYKTLWENPKFSENIIETLKLDDDCMIPNAHKLRELNDSIKPKAKKPKTKQKSNNFEMTM